MRHVKLKRGSSEYMEDKVGEQYEGVITGVTNFGVFVQLPELQILSLIHI